MTGAVRASTHPTPRVLRARGGPGLRRGGVSGGLASYQRPLAPPPLEWPPPKEERLEEEDFFGIVRSVE